MHSMSEQWMDWKSIDTIPNDREQVLVGFMGQFKWFSYCVEANGNKTFYHNAKPTHWCKIIPPKEF